MCAGGAGHAVLPTFGWRRPGFLPPLLAGEGWGVVALCLKIKDTPPNLPLQSGGAKRKRAARRLMRLNWPFSLGAGLRRYHGPLMKMKKRDV
jgi:hypothetical protein